MRQTLFESLALSETSLQKSVNNNLDYGNAVILEPYPCVREFGYERSQDEELSGKGRNEI